MLPSSGQQSNGPTPGKPCKDNVQWSKVSVSESRSLRGGQWSIQQWGLGCGTCTRWPPCKCSGRHLGHSPGACTRQWAASLRCVHPWGGWLKHPHLHLLLNASHILWRRKRRKPKLSSVGNLHASSDGRVGRSRSSVAASSWRARGTGNNKQTWNRLNENRII